MMREKLLESLETSFRNRGWLGRMAGTRKWLVGGHISPFNPEVRTSVIAIKRAPGEYDGFTKLKESGYPFQSVLVRTGHSSPGSCADVTLCLASDAPWYTSFNLGAALSQGSLLIFLDGDADPDPNLLKVYEKAFSENPELVAARGAVLMDNIKGCQTTGSFELAEDTSSWPLDLDENMAIKAADFNRLGGFDESMIGGYGSLELSIRLFATNQDFKSQRYLPRAILKKDIADFASFGNYLSQRQKSWLQLNESMKRYLELYGKFWQEKSGEGVL